MNVLSLAAPERGFLRLGLPLTALLVFSLMLNGPLSAQNASDPPTLNNVVIPPSPDAAALGEYAEVPVGLYTGVPQVSVPIWNLQGRRLSVPISLSYHASGIKVDQIASRVGLGWALQAGGTISRSVNGKPDEGNNGYFQTINVMPTPVTMGANQVYWSTYDSASYANVVAMADGFFDGTPDNFNLSFPGGNAQMFFDGNGGPHLIPYGLMDIEVDWAASTWLITTADGVKYHFGGAGAMEESNTTFSNWSAVDEQAVTAWHLTKIEDPAGDVIDFIYEAEAIPTCQPIPASETYYANTSNNDDCTPPGASYSWGNVCTDVKRIKEIVSARGKVAFHYAPTSRLDQNGSHALERVEILTKQDEIIKEFRLYQSYWSNRLMLDEVVEYNGCQAKPGQKFEYDKDWLLPPVGSKSRDHWGFYNGKPNQSLIPRIDLGNCNYHGSANREPDFDYGKNGMLTKITHPTGGTTSFEYESHSIWSGQYNPQRVPESAIAQTDCPLSSGICNPPNQSTQTFNIDHGQCVNFNVQFSNPSGPGSCGGRVLVKRVSNGTTVAEWVCGTDVPGNYEKFLSVGDYELEVTSHNGGDQTSISAQFERELPTSFDRPIGGVRIKSITDFDNEDPTNNLFREFVYEAKATPGQSSGVLVNEPNYLFDYTEIRPDPNMDPDHPNPQWRTITCDFTGISSSPRGTNGNGGGPHIGYAEVQTLYGQNGANGSSVATFTTAHDYPDSPSEWPFGPDLSRSHLRGMPKANDTFKADGTPINSSSQVYTFRTENATETVGLMAGFRTRHPFFNCPTCDVLMYRAYPIRSEWFYTGSTTTRQYDPTGTNFTETTTTYEYDNPNHIQVTATRVLDSEGRELITRTSYPDDIALGTGSDPFAQAILSLKNKFMKATPIEATVWQKKPNQQEELLKANLTKYKILQSNMVLPVEVWALESDQPGTAFNPIDASSGVLNQDSRYRLLETVEKYDQYGNLVQMKKEKGSRVSFKWSHDRTLPVAQVIDAGTPYQAGQPTDWVLNGETAYTGFESGVEDDHSSEEDFWSFIQANEHVADAHTGKLARRVQPGVQQYGPIRELKPEDPNARFVFSAWVRTPANYAGGKLVLRSKQDSNDPATFPSANIAPSYQQISIPPTNNTWQLLEVKLDLKAVRAGANLPQSVPLRIAASVENNDPSNPLDIDDLRILPERARMTNYAYEPMVGQLATLDENNRASHFQYDRLWRMESASDHNQLVRKVVNYQYAMNEAHVHSDAINDKANVGDLVNFTATTSIACEDGAIYTWDFGDGTIETGASYRFHTYLNPGIYQVSLTVNSAGHSATTTQTITILN